MDKKQLENMSYEELMETRDILASAQIFFKKGTPDMNKCLMQIRLVRQEITRRCEESF